MLTHLHCDHMLDACTYVVVRRYDPGGPKPPLPVYAPLGAAERISAAYSSENEPVDDVYTFFRLQPGTFPIGPFTVTVDRVNHPIETYGVRVEQGGRVLAYSSDTAPCESLLRLPRVPTCSSARRATSTAWTTRPTCTSPAARRARRRPRRTSAGCC